VQFFLAWVIFLFQIGKKPIFFDRSDFFGPAAPAVGPSWSSVLSSRTVCGFLPLGHGQIPPVLWDAKKTEKNTN
jgi:hypothetical protein